MRAAICQGEMREEDAIPQRYWAMLEQYTVSRLADVLRFSFRSIIIEMSSSFITVKLVALRTKLRIKVKKNVNSEGI